MTVVPRIAGYALTRGFAVGAGHAGRLRLPARFFLLDHPQAGRYLIDTGYSPDYWRATRRLPFRLMRYLIPAEITTSARQLVDGEVAGVVVSHWHPDHMAGLDDFSGRLLGDRVALEESLRLSPWAQLLRGFLPALAPRRPVEDIRACPRRPLPEGFEELGSGYDLFGDGSCLAVDLPGHLLSHFGFLIEGQPRTLLVTDACYHLDELESPPRRRLPWLTRQTCQSPRLFAETQEKLRRLRARFAPEQLRMWASHHA